MPTAITVDSTGVRVGSAQAVIEAVQARYELLSGESPDWENDPVIGPLVEAIVTQVAVPTAEAVQAIADALDRQAATGVSLENHAGQVNVDRREPTYSEVTVTITGTAGTAIPEGFTCAGGGADGRAKWRLMSSVVMAGSSQDVDLVCTELGAVEAAIGEVDAVVTPISGVTSVTNTAAANAGTAVESDAELRRRADAARAVGPGTSAVAMQSAILELLSFAELAAVFENTQDTTQVVEGISMDPHSMLVVEYHGTGSLTATQQAQLARLIAAYKPEGIEMLGTETATVVTDSGVEVDVAWRHPSTVNVQVDITVTLEAGWTLAEVSPAILVAVESYRAALTMGDDVLAIRIIRDCADIEGVRDLVVDLDSGSTAVTITAVQIADLTPINVST